MPSVCELCMRGPLRGNSISHSNAKTIKRQKLNLQTKKVDGVRMKICARCLKTLLKPKLVRKSKVAVAA